MNLELRYSDKVDKSSSCQYKQCENEPDRSGQAVAREKLGKIIKKMNIYFCTFIVLHLQILFSLCIVFQLILA